MKYSYDKDYPITIEDYNLIFEMQQGKCKICGIHQKDNKRKLCIDHCHKTNKVRGLLCNHCNTGLGFFKDNTKSLLEAVNYLNNSKNFD